MVKSLAKVAPALEVLPKTTLRKVLDDIPKGKGLEVFGFDLTKVRLMVSSIGTEVGRMAGGFMSGLFQGYMDKARPIVENIVDYFDKKNERK
jgi:hypothetical protein